MDRPIACELGPDALRARREELLVGLAARATKQEETVEPDDGPITLTLSGPHGSRESLSALFASH